MRGKSTEALLVWGIVIAFVGGGSVGCWVEARLITSAVVDSFRPMKVRIAEGSEGAGRGSRGS